MKIGNPPNMESEQEIWTQRLPAAAPAVEPFEPQMGMGQDEINRPQGLVLGSIY